MQTPNEITQVLERMLPVGSIVEWAPVDGGKADLSTPEKVAAYYGFGAWEAYGSGQMLLGVSGSHAVGSTGGEETHTLTIDEIPSHGHTLGYPDSSYTQDFSRDMYLTDGYGLHWRPVKSVLQAGGGQPHNNMPPYVTVYRWRRIA